MLPCYPAFNSNFSEDVLIPEKIKIKTEVQNIRFVDISSSSEKPALPKREIISPKKMIQREIIKPPAEENGKTTE